MANIQPFKALRPDATKAAQLASKPYDVLSSAEARIEAQGNGYSFLHITKSEIDLPADLDVHAPEVYTTALENLENFISRGILFQEQKPCFYIYELQMNGRSQTGLVAGSSIDDYNNNIILKHEFTRPEKETDRINHIATTKAQTGNVFLAYKNVAEIDELISNWCKSHSPIYNFTTQDEVAHAIWIVNDEEVGTNITKLFNEKVSNTYIADGHHRAASAAKAKLYLQEKGISTSNFFLTTLFPASQLQIMDYNRVAKDLNGLTAEGFMDGIEKNFNVSKSVEAFKPKELHQFGMYLGTQWYTLTAKDGTYENNEIDILDVSILQKNVLGNLLGINDPRTNNRVDFIGGIRGLKALEDRVNSGEAAVAFSLYPVSIQQLFNIAESGNVMPPKSTWFEPKLRDGLLTLLINE
jgi:uncharacterized protein (DUF1015 family)